MIFVFPYTPINIWYFSTFWLASLCITSSRFIHLTSTDSNSFLFMCAILVSFWQLALLQQTSPNMSMAYNDKSLSFCSYIHQRKLCSCSTCLCHYESQAKGATLSETCCCHAEGKRSGRTTQGLFKLFSEVPLPFTLHWPKQIIKQAWHQLSKAI